MTRMACDFEFKFSNSGPEGSFEGYGAIFGNQDEGGDVILPGAFDAALRGCKASGKMPKMLLQHAGMPYAPPRPTDLIPVGKWGSMAEDSKGLAVAGRLINLDTESGKRIYGAMKEGEMDSLSIGYVVGDFVRGSKAGDPRRTIKNMRKLHEVSIVTFPMNTLATVSGVKSADLDADSFAAFLSDALPGLATVVVERGWKDAAREFEKLLRDEAGFSHAAAKAIAVGGFKATPEPRDEDGSGEIAERLNRLAALLKS